MAVNKRARFLSILGGISCGWVTLEILLYPTMYFFNLFFVFEVATAFAMLLSSFLALIIVHHFTKDIVYPHNWISVFTAIYFAVVHTISAAPNLTAYFLTDALTAISAVMCIVLSVLFYSQEYYPVQKVHSTSLQKLNKNEHTILVKPSTKKVRVAASNSFKGINKPTEEQ